MNSDTKKSFTDAGMKFRIVKARDVSANTEASDIISIAHQEAEHIKSEAEQEAKSILEEAKNKAKIYEEQAREAASKFVEENEEVTKEKLVQVEQEERIRVFEEISAEIATIQRELSQTESAIIELVKGSLESIIGKLEKEDLILRVVQRAIINLQEQTGMTLRVSSADYDAAQTITKKLQSPHDISPIRDVEVCSKLKPDEYRIVSVSGITDLDIKGQISHIIKGLSISIEE